MGAALLCPAGQNLANPNPNPNPNLNLQAAEKTPISRQLASIFVDSELN